MSNRANLANGITATATSASSNIVTLQPGYAAGMPPVPFFATITPFGQLPTMGNSEIVQVTSASGNNLSVVRAQKGTVAKSFPAGSVFTNSVYADDKITADNIDLTTMPDNKYTTTKQNTGQKWINEKPIFRQVFTVNTRAQGNVEQIIDIGLPKAASLTIIKVEGGLRAGVDFYPIEYINPNAPSGQNSQLKLTFYNESWQLRFNTGSAGVLTVIVYYTE